MKSCWAERKCVPCAQKMEKNAVEDASSKPHTVANKVALPYVC